MSTEPRISLIGREGDIVTLSIDERSLSLMFNLVLECTSGQFALSDEDFGPPAIDCDREEMVAIIKSLSEVLERSDGDAE